MTDRTNNHENGLVHPATTRIKRLVIEWRHLVVDGATCERCGATGSEVKNAVNELTKELGALGIKVVFKETPLNTDQLEESNMVLLNGKPLEDLIAGGVTETPCSSCSTLTGMSACCRAVEVDKQLGITAEIKKIEEISQIMERGVMMLPAIIIDGDLKVSGRIADVTEIKKFLSGGT